MNYCKFLFILFCTRHLIASEPVIQSLYVSRINQTAYEVQCVIIFPGFNTYELKSFCWDAKNIRMLLNDESVEINYQGNDSIILISYLYKYLFFKFYSTYQRSLDSTSATIHFKLLSNKHNIPFVPQIEKDEGFYSFSTIGKDVTMFYYQRATCKDAIPDYYFNYARKKVFRYFKSFIAVVEKNL